jgi:serine/threonine protein kinase
MGYFFDITDNKFLGIIILCILVGVTGWAMGAIIERVSRKIKNKAEKSLVSLQKDMIRTRNEALKKIEIVENTIKKTGPYHRDSGHYNNEIRYVHDQVNNIRYYSGNARSVEEAAFLYGEIINYLDGIMVKIDPYSASTSWTLEEKKYEKPYWGNYKRKKEKEVEETDKKEEIPKEFVLIKPADSYVTSLRPPVEKSVNPRISGALPNYSIKKQINSNEFADIFSGDSDDGLNVVIKVPRIEKGKSRNVGVMAEFISGVDQWDRLKDDNIVKIYGRDVRPAFHIVMERMNGGDLKVLMENHELTLEEAVHIMLQVLQGVCSAHEKGIFHGNLKPSNILFQNDGELKISDWGWEEFQNTVNPGRFISEKCKFGYCSPEHLEPKEFGKVDEATDQFHLGILFYEMLTGVNPFDDEEKEKVAENIIEKELDPPSFLNLAVPDELDELILKALEKKKEARWKSTKLMYDELNRLVVS